MAGGFGICVYQHLQQHGCMSVSMGDDAVGLDGVAIYPGSPSA